MHEHDWQVQSEHATSSGTVTYSHCHCGTYTMSLRQGTEDLLAAIVKNDRPSVRKLRTGRQQLAPGPVSNDVPDGLAIRQSS